MKNFIINLLKPSSGISSKRFGGLVLSISPLVLSLFCIIFASTFNKTIPVEFWGVMTTSIITGAGLLGSTMLEKKNNENK